MKAQVLFFTLGVAVVAACGSSSTNVNVNGGIAAAPNSNAGTQSTAATPANANTSSATPAATATPANVPSYKEPGPPPTPLGTPSKANVGSGKITKPGATPTPGIPSPEEIKRILSRPATGNPNTPSAEPPAMKPGRPFGGRMTNSNKPQ